MLDSAISPDQVCAQTGVTFSVAQSAVYMRISANHGWSMADFMQRTGMSSRDARSLAFKFGIEFPDYPPCADPIELEWRKDKPGWKLYRGDQAIGSCTREATGQYDARIHGVKCDVKVMECAWDPRAAMAKAAAAIDAISPLIFDGQPVRASIIERDGSVVTLFPAIDETFHACRKAFGA